MTDAKTSTNIPAPQFPTAAAADKPAPAEPCCDTAKKATCCEPAAKGACCGPTGDGSKGCC